MTGSGPLPARVLIVAGSDSSGGAGIQADIKTVTALGGYAATAITALTAQSTRGVFGVVGVDPAFVVQQIELVLDDIGADAIKTGMLHSAAVIRAVAGALAAPAAAGVPLVVDPVMVAQSGGRLLEESAVAALRDDLLPLGGVLTPNLPEAEVLLGRAVPDAAAMPAAARDLLALGPRAVLLKGGHLAGDVMTDVLVWPGGERIFSDPRIATDQTHGTGCTLASAVATGLGQGLALPDAVARARAYLQEALRRAPGFGKGQGPVLHGHTVRPFHA